MERKIYNLVAIAIALTMAFSSMTVTAQASEVCEVFSDVKHDSWYEEAVQYVYDNGIMSGSNGAFKPTDNITRAQLVTTLYRIAGEPEVTDRSAVSKFSDVAEGKYYTDAVCWAYNEGITTGSNGKFNPHANLTREQMVVFLGRYSNKLNISYPNMFGTYVLNNMSDYAFEDVIWAIDYGLLTGTKVNVNGRVYLDANPKGNATRAQVATILMRFCGMYGV